MALIIAVLHAVVAVSLYFLGLPVAAFTLGAFGLLLSAYLTPSVYAHRGDLALYGQRAARASWRLTSSTISRSAYALSLLLVYASLSLAAYALVPREWFSGVFFGILSLLSVLIASLAARSQVAPHHFFVATLFFLCSLLIPFQEGYALRIAAAIIHLLAMAEMLRRYTLSQHGLLFTALAVSLVVEVLVRSFGLALPGTVLLATLLAIAAFELSEKVSFLESSYQGVRIMASLFLAAVASCTSTAFFWYDLSLPLVAALLLSSLFLFCVHFRYCNLLTLLVAIAALALFSTRLVVISGLSPWLLLVFPILLTAVAAAVSLPHSVDKKAFSLSGLLWLLVAAVTMMTYFGLTGLWALSLYLLLLAAAAVTVARSFRR